ncbi:MAG TPA: dihydroneopterin aldolase [Bacteroidia bacterium]|nr:dihydroneopterin aldolase [Bacteroidia bacterium]
MSLTTITISDIRCRAFHGCLNEESRIGTDFTIDVEFTADTAVACEKDELSGTIDYVTVHRIVREQMAIRSKLIENVAARILQALKEAFPGATTIRLSVSKHRPPINNGYLGKATVTLFSGKLE